MIGSMSQLPKFMRAAQASDYGGVDQYKNLLSVQENVAVPSLKDEYKPVNQIHPLMRYATKLNRKTHMIVKTLAVSLAPGDCRVLSGKTREFQGPPSFPYIPGGDCCGVVVETSPNEKYFQPGDVVAARFTLAPRDAMAEYARVSTSVCEKIKDTSNKISPVEAAALASASPAVIVSDYIRPNERILILGAGGGIGSHLCQLARLKGASYICGTSSVPKRLLAPPLNCDDAVDYTEKSVFDIKRYQEEPFDTIIDLACGGWPQLMEHRSKKLKSIVKPASEGGRFLTICTDTATMEGHTFWQVLSGFFLQPLWRSLWTRFYRNSLPSFTKINALPDTREVMTRTLDLAHQGKLKAVVDGPYPMTTAGVQQAFTTQASRHEKGKVVVQVAKT